MKIGVLSIKPNLGRLDGSRKNCYIPQVPGLPDGYVFRKKREESPNTRSVARQNVLRRKSEWKAANGGQAYESGVEALEQFVLWIRILNLGKVPQRQY